MDVITFLASINKISIIAFLITLVFLGYEVILIRKERQKSGKPSIPQFQASAGVAVKTENVAIKQDKKKVFKHGNFFIIALVVLLILFGGGAAVGFMNFSSSSSTVAKITPTPEVSLLTSRGVRLFSEDFIPMTDQQAADLKPGYKIVIGVETVDQADIDSARIRVNKLQWTTQDITTRFDAKNKMYYITYKIATAESQLKIEAQLHSKSDGWLGE